MNVAMPATRAHEEFVPVRPIKPKLTLIPIQPQPFMSVIRNGNGLSLRLDALAREALGNPHRIDVLMSTDGNAVVIRPGEMYAINGQSNTFSCRPLINRMGLQAGRYPVDVEQWSDGPVVVLRKEQAARLAS